MRALARRGVICALAGAISGGLAATSANAALRAGGQAAFASPVTLGQTDVPAVIAVRNENTGPQGESTNVVCNFGDALPCPADDPGITVIASCGVLGARSRCDPAGADPGVFRLSPLALGAPGTACAGMIFDVLLIDPVLGRWRFTPQPPGTNVVLPGAGTCRIAFSLDVLKMPTIDSDLETAGSQTVQIVDNTQRLGEDVASDRDASDGVTVQRAAPSISTSASPDITAGAGQLTDTAVVSGRVDAQPGATIDFALYGPDDATCSGPAVFESPGVPYPVEGATASSAPFTPATPGTYRWRATYSGDANNLPAAGQCNDSGENVVVNQGTPGPSPSPGTGTTPATGTSTGTTAASPEPIVPAGTTFASSGPATGTAVAQPPPPPAVAGASLTPMTPFPVVRIVGRTTARGAKITRMTVRAAVGTQVVSRCVANQGACPFRRRASRIPGRSGRTATFRLRGFERSFEQGTVLRVYVVSEGRVGKFTSFRIRRGRAPLRSDGCVAGVVLKPVRCTTS